MVEIISIKDIIRDTLYYIFEDLAFDDSISFGRFNEKTINYLRKTYLLNNEEANWFYNPIYWKLFLDKDGKESPLFQIQARKEGEAHRVGTRIDSYSNFFVDELARSIYKEHTLRFASKNIFRNYFNILHPAT